MDVVELLESEACFGRFDFSDRFRCSDRFRFTKLQITASLYTISRAIAIACATMMGGDELVRNVSAQTDSSSDNEEGEGRSLNDSLSTSSVTHNLPSIDGIEFVDYVDERQLEDVMRLVGQDLSEPYSGEEDCALHLNLVFEQFIILDIRIIIITCQLSPVFTYRYFLHRWPKLCILAVPKTTTSHGGDGNERSNTEKSANNEEVCQGRRPVGCVVCKIDVEGGEGDDDCEDSDRHRTRTGYIGMLAVENAHRRSGIGSALVQRAIHRMQQMGCQSIRLETEVTNKAAISLYENRLGFLREELLKKYYLNWGDAYRLRLWLDDE